MRAATAANTADQPRIDHWISVFACAGAALTTYLLGSTLGLSRSSISAPWSTSPPEVNVRLTTLLRPDSTAAGFGSTEQPGSSATPAVTVKDACARFATR